MTIHLHNAAVYAYIRDLVPHSRGIQTNVNHTDASDKGKWRKRATARLTIIATHSNLVHTLPMAFRIYATSMLILVLVIASLL